MASSLSRALSLVWVLGACLLRTDKVALRLDDASALDDDVVAQDPLQPPVSDAQVLSSLSHRLLEGACRYQLWGGEKKNKNAKEISLKLNK